MAAKSTDVLGGDVWKHAMPQTPHPSIKADSKENRCKRWVATQEFIIKHWLPLIFAVAIIWALAWPVPGAYLVHITVAGNVRIVQEVAMGVVFFLSGLALNTQDVKKARGHVGGVVFGFVSILFITPLLGFAMREIPLEPQAFAIGLTIFCVVPTTLGIGVALVRSCKGNDGIALLMTVGTNLLGVQDVVGGVGLQQHLPV